MLNIYLDEKELKKLYLEEVRKRVDEIEEQALLIDTKELCKMLSLSRPTVEKLFIYNQDFPSIRVGKKWLFNRKAVEEYIDRWSKVNKKKGGIVSVIKSEEKNDTGDRIMTAMLDEKLFGCRN